MPHHSLGLQVPRQKVFGPSKPTPNTFLQGTWSPRDSVLSQFAMDIDFHGRPERINAFLTVLAVWVRSRRCRTRASVPQLHAGIAQDPHSGGL